EEHKLSEKKLLETVISKNYFNVILNTMADALIVIGLDGNIEKVNQTMLDLLGYHEEELLGKSYWKILAREEFFSHTSIEDLTFIPAIDSVDAIFLTNVNLKIPVLFSSSMIQSEENQVEKIICLARDIRVRKEFQKKLEESEARLKSIVNTAASGIITIDQQGIIESVNPETELLFGYLASEMVGKNVSILVPSPDRESHDQYLENYLKTGESQIIGAGREARGQRKDGTIFSIFLAVSEINLGDKRFFTGIIHDLSKQKQIENALRESEGKIRSLVESTIDIIIRIDLDFKITYINHPVPPLTADQVIGTNCLDYTEGLHVNAAKESLEKVFQGENVSRETHAEVDGHLIWFHTRYSPIYLEGKVVGATMISTDITLQKESQKNEDFLASLVESSEDAILGLSPTGEVSSWNRGAEKIFGYSVKEIEGKSFTLLMPPSEIQYSNKYLKKLRSGGSFSNLRTKLLHKNGRAIDVSITDSPILDADGDFVGISSILKDITKNVKLENELKENTEMLQMVTDNIPALIAYVDQDNRYRFVNNFYETTYKIPAMEILGSRVEDLLGKSVYEESIPFLKKVLNGEKAEFVSTRYPKGVARIHKVTLIPYLQTGIVKGYFVLAHDITEYQEMEEKLRIAKKQADAASHEKSQFLANMSHEIRTPIGVVIGFSEVLLKKGKELSFSEEVQRFQKNIHSSSKLLLELVNNILDLSKIESGKMEILETDFSLREMIDGIVNNYSFHAGQKGVQFSYEISSKLPDSIRSDRTKIIQILTNLVGNAIKFTPEGREVKLKLLGDHSNLALMVIDEGIGIPEDRHKAIFETFVQASQSTAQNFGGTGLGLPITKKLVEMLGGKISVNSVGEGKGSNFTARIPIKKIIAPVTQIEKAVGAELVFSKESSVLVVEDNLMNQEMIKAMLKEFEIKVHFSENGEEGVERILELHAEGTLPDLVLMDMQMPVMDGAEATRQIRTKPELKDMPIVGLSADAFSEQQKEAIGNGMDDYLTKPITGDVLLNTLIKYLPQESANN
ncbi:MAG: PAS domain S-box protein, partial [SAR324 cluster bacterium]|nr:PAS domain S-box protein [SAR324 cluster bacterium]